MWIFRIGSSSKQDNKENQNGSHNNSEESSHPQVLQRPVNKKSLALADHDIRALLLDPIDVDGRVPSIEAVTSFSPTYSESSSSSSSSGSSPSSRSTGTGSWNEEAQVLSVLVDSKHLSAATPSPTFSFTKQGNNNDQEYHYVSKDELDLQVLLTPRFLQDYQDLLVDGHQKAAHHTTKYHVQQQAKRELRRNLIQTELDVLIQDTQDNEALKGHEFEFEPEAVEALGIAANQVAYLKKYYNMASCQYTYVPSVAHCLLKGTLLEAAGQHYFGRSDEFLVAYAARLGSTIILTQQQHDEICCFDIMEEEENLSQAEDVDLGEEEDSTYIDNNVEDAAIHLNTASNAVWGWSPRSQGGGGEQAKTFDVEKSIPTTMSSTTTMGKSPTIMRSSRISPRSKCTTRKLPLLPKLILAMLLSMTITLALVGHFSLLPSQQQHPQLSDLVADHNENQLAKTCPRPLAKDDDATLQNLQSIVQEVQTIKIPIPIHDQVVVKLQAIAQELKVTESSSTASQVTTTSSSKPIVVNLLY